MDRLEYQRTTGTDRGPQWARGLLTNDPGTIHRIYADHFPAVRRYVLQNSGGVEDAKDVFQEAMSTLWVALRQEGFQASSDPGGFLFRVAKNKWLDVLRSAGRRRLELVDDERRLDGSTEELDGIEERILRLRAVYAGLDEKCRSVLDKFYFEGKDLSTIAADMRVELDSIRTIKYRCMMKLRAFKNTISDPGVADQA